MSACVWGEALCHSFVRGGDISGYDVLPNVGKDGRGEALLHAAGICRRLREMRGIKGAVAMWCRASTMGRGGGTERGVCDLHCNGRREVTVACQSSQEGVHGGGEVGCRVSRGIFVGQGRVPYIFPAAVELCSTMRVFFSPREPIVGHP